MKFNLSITVLFIGLMTHAYGQGLVFNDDAYKKIPRADYGDSGAKGDDPLLKNVFKVDLKPFCPEVKHQGNISSCVGWAVGYGAMTIEKAVLNNLHDKQAIDASAFSPLYLYNQIKLADCDFGAELNQGLTFLKEKGNVLFRDFPVQTNCDSVPPVQLINKARMNRVKDFNTLFQPEDTPEAKISRVKSSLVRKKPVVIGIVLLNNFLQLRPGDETWYPNVGKTDLFGGHAMVVIGYDDGRKAFEVMNSWGTEWANAGFVWIRYEDFSHYCKYAYQLVLDEGVANYLEGSVQLLKPAMKNFNGNESEVLFSPISLSGNAGVYKLGDDQKRLPLQFQLKAEAFKKESYLYVISLDQNFNASIQWPRNAKYNSRFNNEYGDGSIPNTLPVIIPDKYNLFSITSAGTEYLCILNSSKPIADLVRKMQRVKNLKGGLRDRIEQSFNSNFPSNKEGAVDQVNFFVPDKPGSIVSILIELDTNKSHQN